MRPYKEGRDRRAQHAAPLQAEPGKREAVRNGRRRRRRHERGWENGSGAELAKMMVGVEVAKAHPLRPGEMAEVGMRSGAELSRRLGEALDQVAELLHIAGEIRGGSAAGLLVELGKGLETVRPGNGRPKGHPFEQQPGSRNWSRLGRPIAHIEPETIAEMADHVVSGHASPASLAGRLDGFETAQDFGFVGCVAKTFHGGRFSGMTPSGMKIWMASGFDSLHPEE